MNLVLAPDLMRGNKSQSSHVTLLANCLTTAIKAIIKATLSQGSVNRSC